MDQCFVCSRCHYKTPKRSNITRHYDRKNECHAMYSDETLSSLLEKLNETLNVCKCTHCDKTFSSQQYLSIHMNTCIHAKIDEMQKRVEQLEYRNKELVVSSYIATQQLNINNIQQQYNTQINNNNHNITINVFGSEDRSHVHDNLMKECFETMTIIPLIKNVYFNEEHPENRTIKLLSEKKKQVEVHEGNDKWSVRDLISSIDTMINIEYKNIIKFFYDVIYSDPSIDFEKKAYAQEQIVKLNNKNIQFFEQRRKVQALLKTMSSEIPSDIV